MPKTNIFITYFAWIVLRLIGDKVTLDQVKATTVLEDLKDKLTEAIKKEHGESMLRHVLVENLNNAIKNAVKCVKVDFTAESWIAAVSLIKARSPKSCDEIIDQYTYAVIYHMQGDAVEQAKRAYQRVVEAQMKAMAVMYEEPDLLAISEKTRQAMIKMLDQMNTK